MTENTFHRKFRPQTLDRVLGHEKVVTRLRGMIESNEVPNALAFFGPPSAGKTTLARIVAATVNGKPVEQQQDYKEINAATQKGIDDVRELDKLARFRPMGKRRFIVIDEAQQVLTNAQAAQALLKPLEEPKPDTTWIICSMEPERFGTTKVGQAMLSRCTQLHLDAPTPANLLKQAIRIAKAEEMSYVLDEDRAVLKKIVRNSGGNMRDLANVIQGLKHYYTGLEKKPKLLSEEDVASVLSTSESSDEEAAMSFMISLYSLNFGDAQRALLDVKDGFGFVKKVCWMAQFIMNVKALDGAKHPAIKWWGKNPELLKAIKPLDRGLAFVSAVYARLIRIQSQAMSFQIPAQDLLSAETFYLIQELKAFAK